MFNVLVLCTGNSARSILAEALFNTKGTGRLVAFSAGSNPTGSVNPGAIRLLERQRLPTNGYRSKSWNEFAMRGAPHMNAVLTVCASAAGESCPIWPGTPIAANWAIDDPAAAADDEIDLAFQHAWHLLSQRVEKFLALPFETMAGPVLRSRLIEIGQG